MLDDDVSNIEFSPEKLELALSDAEVSQAELSKIAGYKHRNTVNKIIKGKREATATDLLRFSAALNKNPKDFAKT